MSGISHFKGMPRAAVGVVSAMPMANPQSPISNRQSRRAFTFMELMIAVIIIGLMVAMAAPRMSKIARSNELKMETRGVVSLLKYARAEAIARRQRVEVRFDLKNHRYRMDLLLDGLPANLRAEEELPLEDEEELHALPESMAFSTIITFDPITKVEDETGNPHLVVLRFYPRGTVTGAKIVLQTLEEQRKREEYMTVEIFRTTGIVESYKGRPKGEQVEMWEAPEEDE